MNVLITKWNESEENVKPGGGGGGNVIKPGRWMTTGTEKM